LLFNVKLDWHVGENVKKPDGLIVETVSNLTICARRISVATSFTAGCAGRTAADSWQGTTVRKSDNSYSYERTCRRIAGDVRICRNGQYKKGDSRQLEIVELRVSAANYTNS
jgi:hypothetical protein